MGKFFRGLGHTGIAALNIASVYGGLIPGKYAPVAMAVQGLAHAILDMINRKPVQEN